MDLIQCEVITQTIFASVLPIFEAIKDVEPLDLTERLTCSMILTGLPQRGILSRLLKSGWLMKVGFWGTLPPTLATLQKIHMMISMYVSVFGIIQPNH